MTKQLLEKISVIGIASLFSVGVFASEQNILELRDGNRVKSERFHYENQRFNAPGLDEKTIARDDVAVWRLTDTPELSATVPPSSPVIPDIDRLECLETAYTKARDAADEHPGVIGVQVVDHGAFILAHDGAHRYRYHFVGLILNDEAMDWARLSLHYKKGRNIARIVEARSYSPTAGIETLATGDVQESSPSQDGQFFSTDLKTINAVIPGAEVGVLVEFIIEFNDPTPEVPELFSPSFYFQSDIPVLSSRLDVMVPTATPLNHWTENWPQDEDEIMPIIDDIKVENERYTRYRWHLRDMPPTVDEPQAPPASEIVPAVHTTLLSDWQKLDALIGDMQTERIQVNAQITELAKKITASSASDEERLAAIYHWVQKNIRYISVKSSLSSGWSGHPSTQTLEQGYGDCTDKSVLFSALLRAVNIDANPVVVRTNDRGFFTPQFPVVNCNHCITKVFLNDQAMYLDTTSQDYRYPTFRADDHGVMAFDFIDSVYEPVPVPSPELADFKYSRETIELNAAGQLRVTTENTYTGQYEARLRGGWKTVPDQLREHIMQQFLNSIAPGSRLISFVISDPADLSQPFTMKYTLENDTLISEAGDYLVLQLPGRELDFPEVSLDDRRYPIAYTTAEKRMRHSEIIPGDNLTLIEIPTDMAIQTTGPTVYTETFEKQEECLIFTSEFLRTPQRISTADYTEFRDALRAMRKTSKRVLLFKKQTP